LSGKSREVKGSWTPKTRVLNGVKIWPACRPEENSGAALDRISTARTLPKKFEDQK